MQAPGAAQIELIRRYSRTLRHLQADGGRFSRPRPAVEGDELRREADRVAEVLDAGPATTAGGPAAVA